MNISEIFAEIELNLLSRMTKSIASENWRSNRFRAFKEFQQQNADLLQQYDIDSELTRSIREAYEKAGYSTEADIKKAIAEGHKSHAEGASFHVNDDKIKSLSKELQGEFKTVETAALRQIDDMYRKTMQKTITALSTNLYTLNQSIDMAAKDFLSSGINCIKYADGRQVNIVSYAEMALRTGNRRATLQGEGDARKEWGESLVYVSQYGACSEICLPYQGRVYVDDVYSGGVTGPNDEYPPLSRAIDAGLFHPNCRHKSSTWYPDISKVPPVLDKEKCTESAELEEKQRYNERQIRKYKRMAEGSQDEQSKLKYSGKVRQWQDAQRRLIGANPTVLRRDYPREQLRGLSGGNRLATT